MFVIFVSFSPPFSPNYPIFLLFSTTPLLFLFYILFLPFFYFFSENDGFFFFFFLGCIFKASSSAGGEGIKRMKCCELGLGLGLEWMCLLACLPFCFQKEIWKCFELGKGIRMVVI